MEVFWPFSSRLCAFRTNARNSGAELVMTDHSPLRGRTLTPIHKSIRSVDRGLCDIRILASIPEETKASPLRWILRILNAGGFPISVAELSW